jgi:hypothetical protein
MFIILVEEGFRPAPALEPWLPSLLDQVLPVTTMPPTRPTSDGHGDGESMACVVEAGQ